jgi:hypothetical protein
MQSGEVPETVPALAFGLTPMAKLADKAPSPQGLIPLTVRLPEVADPEKSIVIEFVVPLTVAPVPEYAHE